MASTSYFAFADLGDLRKLLTDGEVAYVGVNSQIAYDRDRKVTFISLLVRVKVPRPGQRLAIHTSTYDLYEPGDDGRMAEACGLETLTPFITDMVTCTNWSKEALHMVAAPEVLKLVSKKADIPLTRLVRGR